MALRCARRRLYRDGEPFLAACRRPDRLRAPGPARRHSAIGRHGLGWPRSVGRRGLPAERRTAGWRRRRAAGGPRTACRDPADRPRRAGSPGSPSRRRVVGLDDELALSGSSRPPRQRARRRAAAAGRQWRPAAAGRAPQRRRRDKLSRAGRRSLDRPKGGDRRTAAAAARRAGDPEDRAAAQRRRLAGGGAQAGPPEPGAGSRRAGEPDAERLPRHAALRSHVPDGPAQDGRELRRHRSGQQGQVLRHRPSGEDHRDRQGRRHEARRDR